MYVKHCSLFLSFACARFRLSFVILIHRAYPNHTYYSISIKPSEDLLSYLINVISNSFNGSDYNVTKKQSNIQQHPFIRSESNDILVYSVSVSIPWKWKHFRGIWFSSFFYFRRTPFGMK